MTRDLARAARVLVLPTLALVGAIAYLPGRVELALRSYALLLSGVALVLMLGSLRRAYPRSEPLRASERRTSSTRRDVPASLARLEQETALGVAGAFDFHHRLRPRLRRIASELLALRHATSLADTRGHARDRLGDETWELVRPDRPPPYDRQARGIAINDLRLVVESLERL